MTQQQQQQNNSNNTSTTSSSGSTKHSLGFFPSVRSYVETLEGTRAIEKILVANNGIAAVKGIRSMRKWCYETFGNQHAIRFVVMATPEDIRANAEYVRLADELVQVPGESNRNNYGNVKLIVDIAERTQCDAVWPGWGHSSENPELPDLLQSKGIVFIGPSSGPMRLLGDKISSTIIAQSAGVPTIPWSGSGVELPTSTSSSSSSSTVDMSSIDALCEEACVKSYEEAERVARDKVGYPLMIKASEGGGGKGIRKVVKEEDLRIAYEQVCKEVSGSPVFLMRLCAQSRHLEVQVIADEHGQAIALKSRDCSVQRRHQKIIEEGPVTVVSDPLVLKEMEDAAVRLAKSVGYSCAGTVEYLYEVSTGRFYFLELNPRIQVEHPVTEWITGTNIPSLQLQVAMGIPLHRVPDVRRYFNRVDGHGAGEGKTTTTPVIATTDSDSDSKKFDPRYVIDLDKETPRAPLGHVIAARITAENPDEGFQPTSGNVTELTFRNTPNVWGYFSIRSQGQIHSFSDSQFGHIFAFGDTREKARQNMVIALSEISIRGDIRSTAEYLNQLLERPTFIDNEITTEWLDALIKQQQTEREESNNSKKEGEEEETVDTTTKSPSLVITTHDEPPTPTSPTTPLSAMMFPQSSTSTSSHPTHLHMTRRTFLNVLCASCHTLYAQFTQNTDKWFWYIERGQHPPEDLLCVLFRDMELIYNGHKYIVTGSVSGVNRYTLALNGSYVEVEVKVLRDGGMLVIILPDATSTTSTITDSTSSGSSNATMESHVTYAQTEPNGNLRLSVDGKISVFTKEFDPSEIRANMSGKMVRYLVENGSHVKAGAPFCELECMKMIITVHAPNAGHIHATSVEGATVNQGDIIARLDLDDKSSIKKAALFEGQFPTAAASATPATPIASSVFASNNSNSSTNATDRLREAQDEVARMLAGYDYPDAHYFDNRLHNAICALQLMTGDDNINTTTAGTGTGNNSSHHLLLVHEFVEKMSVLRSAMPKALLRDINALLQAELYHSGNNNNNNGAEPTATTSVVVEVNEQHLMTRLDEIIVQYFHSLGDSKELVLQTKAAILPLLEVIEQYKKGYKSYSFAILSAFVKEYLRVEKIYDSHTSGRPLTNAVVQSPSGATGEIITPPTPSASNASVAAAPSSSSILLELRYKNKDDLHSIYDIALSHERLRNKNRVMVALLREVDRLGMVRDFLPLLNELCAFITKSYSDVVLIAKQMLNKYRLPSFHKMQKEMEQIFHSTIEARSKFLQQQQQQQQPASTTTHASTTLKDMIERSNYGLDMLMTFLNHPNHLIRDLAAEVYIRKAYITFDVSMLTALQEDAQHKYRTVQWRFVNDSKDTNASSSSSIASMHHAGARGVSTNKKDSIVGSVSVDSLTSLLHNSTPPSPTTPTKNHHQGGAGAESEDYVGYGVMSIFNNYEDIESNMESILQKNFGGSVHTNHAEQSNVMSIVLLWNEHNERRWRQTRGGAFSTSTINGSTRSMLQHQQQRYVPSDADFIDLFSTVLSKHSSLLHTLDVRRVTAAVAVDGQFPQYYTFRRHIDYAEDPIYRHLEPTLAFQLFLRKCSNYTLQPVPAIKNPAVHVFFGEKKPQQTRFNKAPAAPEDRLFNRRFFVRTLILQGDIFTPENPEEFQISEAERYLVESLNALELAMADPRYESSYGNHIFVNVLPEIVVNPNTMTTIMSRLQHVYARRLVKLRVNEVELKINIKMGDIGGEVIPLRFICTNKTGYNLTVDIYQEVRDLDSGRTRYSALMVSPDNENDTDVNMDGLDVNTPYRVLEGAALKRRIAHNYDTSYVYDYPYLFERALKQIWKHYALSNNFPPKKVLPKNYLVAREMVLNPHTFQLEYKSQQQQPHETYGMVVWRMTMKTPEYRGECGRDVIVIANDITFQSGSFGPMEDLVFQRASELSRKEGIPRLYIAANSGARIGLAEEVKHLFQVAWRSPGDPSKGYDYLYLGEEDYLRLREMEIEKGLPHPIVNVDPITVSTTGEKRYRIVDIIGSKHGIGVENLQASGMIAGETSRAYNEVFTLSYVASRTVGIGAYLVRLGQRVIQNRRPPILLTGAGALNKVLGREVYSSNLQLGGTQIMYPNGVTHLVAPDDLRAVRMMLDWLSYVPERVGAPLPIRLPPSAPHANANAAAAAVTTTNTSDDEDNMTIMTTTIPEDTYDLYDSVDREIGFAPVVQQPYNVRHMLAGQTVVLDSATASNPSWVSGFFDRGTFMETLSGWAKNIVCGRGRLGGIPMGVVCVDIGTYEQVIPADPADPTTQERVIQKAGQVWFPDSAYKTAQAIKDFNVGEELPLLVLANWRGFSGGQRDMYDEILKFGSFIVDALVDYKRPVFVYIPPLGELRGGAWVVVDSAINPDFMEMYADKQARGNVLEPSGTVEIKYRNADVLKSIRRLDPEYREMDRQLTQQMQSGNDNNDSSNAVKQLQQRMKQREKQLLPIYTHIAETFCDLHDTAGRMKVKGVIREVLEWKHSRKYFYWRLKRRLLELDIMDRMEAAVHIASTVQQLDQSSTTGSITDAVTASPQRGRGKVTTLTYTHKMSVLKSWIVQEDNSESMWRDDQRVIQWIEQHRDEIEHHLRLLRQEYIGSRVRDLCAADMDTTVHALLSFLANNSSSNSTTTSSTDNSDARKRTIDELQKQVQLLKLGWTAASTQ